MGYDTGSTPTIRHVYDEEFRETWEQCVLRFTRLLKGCSAEINHLSPKLYVFNPLSKARS